jgi:hypothetical protein
MAIPDTHTALFTQIPLELEKEWTSVTKLCADGSIVQPSNSLHSESLISKITIKVEFNKNLMDDRDCFDENDDAGLNAIEVWQAARREWALIESTLQKTVKDINHNQLIRAREKRMRTVCQLGQVRTRSKFNAQRQHREQEYQKPISVVTKRVRTLHPNEEIDPDDSASILRQSIVPSAHPMDMSTMRDYLDILLDQRSKTESNKNKSSQKKSQAGTIETVRIRRRS